MGTSRVQYRVPVSGGDLAGRTAVGVFLGTLGLLVARAVVLWLGIDVGPTGAQSPFATVPLVATMIVAGVGAAVTYAALARLTARPARRFLDAAGIVFLVMLVPVFAFAPSMGVTFAGQVVLVAFHAIAAVPVVALVLGAGR